MGELLFGLAALTPLLRRFEREVRQYLFDNPSKLFAYYLKPIYTLNRSSLIDGIQKIRRLPPLLLPPLHPIRTILLSNILRYPPLFGTLPPPRCCIVFISCIYAKITSQILWCVGNGLFGKGLNVRIVFSGHGFGGSQYSDTHLVWIFGRNDMCQYKQK